MFFEVVCFGCVLIIFLCLFGKPPYQYYAKYLLLGILFTVNAVLALPINLIRPFDNRNQSDLWRLWISPVIPFGLKFRVKGIENIKNKKTALVMINHQSAIDLLVYARILGVTGRCAPVLKKNFIYFGLFGLLTYLGDSVYVDRNKGKEAMQTIRVQMDRIKQTKSKIVIFPEGTRNDSGTLLPFKAGGFRIAIENELPIQPIVVSPYSSFLNHKKKVFTNGRIIIKVLPEIPTSGLTVDDLDELRNKTSNVIAETFEELKEEIKRETEQPICIWKNFFSFDF